jgi:aryl sulfotransferase
MSLDGHPFWPFWENIRSWWQIRTLPHVKLVHFANLKRDLPGQIRLIATYLPGGAFWDAGAEVFIHKVKSIRKASRRCRE